MSVLTDMRDYLSGLDLGVPIYAGNLPPKPANCVALFEYQGIPPEDGYTTTPGVQLLLRTDDFKAGYEILEKASRALLKIGHEDGEKAEGAVINGSLYLKIYTPGSGINQLGKDDNGNSLLSKNFYVIRGGI